MLMLMQVHRNLPVGHVDATFCISESVEPATVLDFCVPEIYLSFLLQTFLVIIAANTILKKLAGYSLHKCRNRVKQQLSETIMQQLSLTEM